MNIAARFPPLFIHFIKVLPITILFFLFAHHPRGGIRRGLNLGCRGDFENTFVEFVEVLVLLVELVLLILLVELDLL